MKDRQALCQRLIDMAGALLNLADEILKDMKKDIPSKSVRRRKTLQKKGKI